MKKAFCQRQSLFVSANIGEYPDHALERQILKNYFYIPEMEIVTGQSPQAPRRRPRHPHRRG
jgi:hypothetical protein